MPPRYRSSFNSDKALPRLPDDILASMNEDLLNPVDYRKTGLSLNHVIGCPLDCSYCVRHLFNNFDMKRPHLIMPDDQAVACLLGHRHFRSHVTPLQLFNRATDPFLPGVKPHTFSVLSKLDEMGLTNHMALITRYRITESDCAFLNSIKHLRITLFITYSGIDDPELEPINSEIAANSLRTAFNGAERYKVVLYWRPIIQGVNDSDEKIDAASELSYSAHATAYTGLFFRPEMEAHYDAAGLRKPYEGTARRKILTRKMEKRIVQRFRGAGLFSKSSCASSYAHGVADYNGHFGVPGLCNSCPDKQRERCAATHHQPDEQDVRSLAATASIIPSRVEISATAITTYGLNEQDRYFLQHGLNYQVHDAKHPHNPGRHGRADIGWE